MARSSKQFGHVQIKAVFILLLLAGGEAVRVTEEVHWGKSEWNKLHADCTWSVNGCGEGCAWKRLPLDKTFSESCRHTDAYLLKHNGLENFHTMVKLFEQKSAKLAEKCQGASIYNRKCKRREAQLLDAFKFIARAPAESNFMTTLSEGDRRAVGDAFESSLKSLVASNENSDVISELLRKMKGHGPAVQRDPKEAVGKLMGLVRRLLSGTPEEKEAAKQEVQAMPDTMPALSADEETKATEKAVAMAKEFDEHRGELKQALDQLDEKTNKAIEEEAEAIDDEDKTPTASSELQLDDDPSPVAQVANGITPPIITATAVGVIPVVLLGLAFPPAFLVAIGIAFLYSWLGFFICDWVTWEGRHGDVGQCMKDVLGFPFTAVKYLAKGTWRLAKGLGRLYVKGVKLGLRMNWIFYKYLFGLPDWKNQDKVENVVEK